MPVPLSIMGTCMPVVLRELSALPKTIQRSHTHGARFCGPLPFALSRKQVHDDVSAAAMPPPVTTKSRSLGRRSSSSFSWALDCHLGHVHMMSTMGPKKQTRGLVSCVSVTVTRGVQKFAKVLRTSPIHAPLQNDDDDDERTLTFVRSLVLVADDDDDEVECSNSVT